MVVGSRVLPLGGAKQRGLLALLLLERNRVVPRDRLVDALWGDAPPASAANSVQVYVSKLRGLLDDADSNGETEVVTEPPGYLLRVPAGALDADEFERLFSEGRAALNAGAPDEGESLLALALALWRGPALADLANEAFAQAEISRLEGLRLQALEARFEAMLALGRQADAVGELQALVSLHPLDERLRRQLMLALYRSGRQADALETYRIFRGVMSDELGLEPSAELRDLEQAILQQDATLGSTAQTLAPAAALGLSAGALLEREEPSRPHLPRPVSSFVGRRHERSEILGRLTGGARLLTLTGPGGSGKTRLAIEVAASVASSKDVVFWVGLASLRDPGLVSQTIAQALSAKGDLAEHIADSEMLVVLDNFEQVIDAAPGLPSLLERCPNLTLLVTSRELLRVQGEVEYMVLPLAEQEAVELFCERSGLGKSEEITELCSRLDSLPLALELAAARTALFSPAQLLERLSQRLDLLKGERGADPRQQTLRATIEWSYDLLSWEEQDLFTRLSVFAGGCSYEAAEQVANADPDNLQSLLDKSLLFRRLESAAGPRYWMLETIREYAFDRLAESHEVDAVMEQLGQYLVDLANEEGAPFYFNRGADAFERLDLEHPNVRVVVDWATRRGRPERVAEFFAVLFAVWWSRGHSAEAAGWVTSALRARGKVVDELWPLVLLGAEETLRLRGDYRRAKELTAEALELLAHLEGQQWPEAIFLSVLAEFALEEGRLDDAQEQAERSLALREEHGIPTTTPLGELGSVALVANELEKAEDLLGRSLAGATTLGLENDVALITRTLGEVARRRGEGDRAIMLVQDALRRYARLGDYAAVGACLKDLAVLEKGLGELARAAQLWAVGSAFEETGGTPFHSVIFPQEVGELPVAAGDPYDLSLEEAVALGLAPAD